MTWLRKNLILILGILVLIYTFIPIFVVILMSFNDPTSRLIYQFDGFTLNNWLNPCEDPDMCSAVRLSIEIWPPSAPPCSGRWPPLRWSGTTSVAGRR